MTFKILRRREIYVCAIVKYRIYQMHFTVLTLDKVVQLFDERFLKGGNAMSIYLSATQQYILGQKTLTYC